MPVRISSLKEIASRHGSIHVLDCCVGADYTNEEREFLRTIQDYKSHCHRPNPSWREVLEIIKLMGYSKVGERVAEETT